MGKELGLDPGQWGTMEGVRSGWQCVEAQYLSNFSGHMNHLGILLKHTFRYSRSGVESEILHV